MSNKQYYTVLYCIKDLNTSSHIPQWLGIKHEKEWKCIETNRRKSVNIDKQSLSQIDNLTAARFQSLLPTSEDLLRHIFTISNLAEYLLPRTIFFIRPSKRHEGLAPLLEAFAAIGLLFLIGAAGFLQPITKQLVVLLQQQVLAQNDVGLVVALLFQPFAQNLSHAGEIRHGFVAHGLGDEVPMFLRSRRHGLG